MAVRRYELTIKGERIAVRCNSTFAQQVPILLETVEECLSARRSLRSGTTLEFGWSVLTLVKFDGEWALCEPDFDGDPFHDIRPDITETLAIASEQATVLQDLEIASKGCPFFWYQRVLYFDGSLTERHIVVHRSAAPKGDRSGWYVRKRPFDARPLQDPPLRALWAYELLKQRRTVLAVMCLPVDYMAAFEGPRLKSVINESGRELLR